MSIHSTPSRAISFLVHSSFEGVEVPGVGSDSEAETVASCLPMQQGQHNDLLGTYQRHIAQLTRISCVRNRPA